MPIAPLAVALAASAFPPHPAAAPQAPPAAAPVLPEAVASFGAAAVDGAVYVYGGHRGRAHAHSRDHVVGTCHRLDLATGAWTELPGGPALQGTALVAGPDGALYRIGGMTAHNAADAEPDLHSTPDVARFVPAAGEWQAVTPLPEPRSSHDAVCLDHHLYVVGGWTLAGGEDGRYATTAWRADLRRQPLLWTPIRAPAPRRAAALAAFDGRLALVGGLGPDGLSAAVECYDPTADTWTAAPPLPDHGFGAAAIGNGAELLVALQDGRLLASDGRQAWRCRGTLAIPRFFHRLVPGRRPGELLALGGHGRGGHTRTTEWVDLGARGPHWLAYELPAPGAATARQGLWRSGHALFAFGGHRDGDGDRFAAGRFADEVWRIDLLDLTARQVARLPQGRQSLLAIGAGRRGRALLVGGLGPTADGSVASSAQTCWWDAPRATLQRGPELPAPRTQGQLVARGDCVYWLGGVDFRPDGDGGGQQLGDPTEVFVCAPAAAAPAFTAAPFRLPRPRRSFGAAQLGDRLFLVGGLGEDFAPAGPIDVFDFATGAWQTLAAPVAWVSPQVAALGDRLYVAGGGTMQGQRFTPDPSLWSWRPAEGWQRVVETLPFATRGVQMLALRDRLWFYAVAPGRIALHVLRPDPALQIAEPAMQH